MLTFDYGMTRRSQSCNKPLLSYKPTVLESFVQCLKASCTSLSVFPLVSGRAL